jgi:hypothetical protein
MCFKPKGPDQGAIDAQVKAERAKAEAEAMSKSNSKLAMKNRSRAASSLMANPLDSTTSEVGALGGKQKLGQ